MPASQPEYIQGTVFGTWYESVDDDHAETTPIYQSTKGDAPVPLKMLRLPSSRESAFMYKYAAGYLRAKGYEHYEVSSYAAQKEPTARIGCGGRDDDDNNVDKSNRSRHNENYWSLCGEWHALGLGATSFVRGHLVARPRTLVDYERWVVAHRANRAAATPASAVPASERDANHTNNTLSQCAAPALDVLLDAVLKRLRTSEGLSLDWVQRRFGDASLQAILRGSKLGRDLSLARLDLPTNTLRLVDPDGFLYSNSIISSIYVELEGL